MQYGTDIEAQERAQLSAEVGKKIQICGLFIDQQYPFLSATPDGLTEDDELVEIKCPYKAKGITVEQALEIHKDLRKIFDTKNPEAMSTSHEFHY